MLQSLKNILNYHIHAKNGSIGRVADFYFDDKAWRTMYLVADCGNWVMGHQKVLIEPQYFDHTDQTEGRLYLNLTQEQVEDSPNIETHTPISKQPLSLKIFTPMSFHHNDKPALLGMINPGDRHLCSLSDSKGLHVEALDGDIGHGVDLIVNDETWDIVWMAVSTRHWWPGKQVLISPELIKHVSWPSRRIYLNMTCQEIKETN